MATVKYDVGDILTWCKDGDCYATAVIVRCEVYRDYVDGTADIQYYDLFYKNNYYDAFELIRRMPDHALKNYKLIGHIDISSFLSDEESSEPDYALFFAAATLAQAADLRNELDKTKKENEELNAENKALSDTLSKSEAKAQSRLNKNEVLKRENEELRGYNKELEQALSKSEEKAHSRLDELENVRDKLKAERDEANHEIDRLRTVVGGLNDVIDDLNASKSEISDLFYSLKNALRTNDILEGVNKLQKENERLSNENRELKAMNDELRSSEKIRKLEEENKRLTQKISCADKLLAEAANRLYQGRAHLNISAHN